MRGQSLCSFLYPQPFLLLFEKGEIDTSNSRVKFSFCCLQSHDSSTWEICGKGYGDSLYTIPVLPSVCFSVVRFTQLFDVFSRQRASDQHSPVSGKQLSSYKPPSLRKEDENVQQGCQECCHPRPWSRGRQSVSCSLRRPEDEAQLSVANSHPSPQKDHEDQESPGLWGHHWADRRAERGLQESQPRGSRGIALQYGDSCKSRRRLCRQHREDGRRAVPGAGVWGCPCVCAPGEVRKLGAGPETCCC